MDDINTLFEVDGRRPVRKPFLQRYSDAYMVASAMLRFAAFVKGAALVVGAVIAIGALLEVSSGGYFPTVVAFFGFGLAVVVAGGGWSFGVIIAAQAQIMKACLDTAVSTSVLGSTEEKVAMLSRA